MIPDLGPLSVLCVVDVTMSQCTNGDGTTPTIKEINIVTERE